MFSYRINLINKLLSLMLHVGNMNVARIAEKIYNPH